MRIEIVCRWSTCDKEFHYQLYMEDLFICEVCSFEVVKIHLRRHYERFYFNRERKVDSFSQKKQHFSTSRVERFSK